MRLDKRRSGSGRMMLMAAVVLGGAVGACWLSQAVAADWLQFRGPGGEAKTAETGWVANWGATGPTIAWRMNVGVGASSMVVAGDRVITMGNKDDRDVVTCINADDGKVLWTHSYPNKFSKRQFDGGTATTPTIDGEHVYVLSDRGDLFCLKLSDGSVVWEKDVTKAFGGMAPHWHYACSPLVEGDMLILNIGGNEASTIALNKRTGAKVWGADGPPKVGYGTPVAFTANGKRFIAAAKARSYVILEADTGKQVTEIDWRVNYDVNSATPIVIDDKMLITGGYRSGRTALYSLRTNPPSRIWLSEDMAAKYCSPVVHEGYVYGVSGDRGGALTCLRLSDGKTMWTESGFGNGTVIIADDKLVALAENGTLVVAHATHEGYRPISKAKVLDGRSWVLPVLANGRIYCRNNQGDLACVDVRPKSSATQPTTRPTR